MIDHTVENNLNHLILFLDFCKAFDSVSHQFLFQLLKYIGVPDYLISWVKILYSQAISVVHYKNWLSDSFPMNRGVCQGCPLSCHLFNLVGQVLVYSLHDAGFFAWWSKPRDPCSLYADDTVLFIMDKLQLPVIISHIQYVSHFTGLTLNLDKTIAFHHCTESEMVAGVEIRNTPVSFLGAFLGCGDLSELNFQKPLRQVRYKLNKWNKRKLTLPA